MHLVADSVAGPGEVEAVLGRNGLQVAVVVMVLEVRLQGVVVHVADGDLRLDPRDADRLELQVGHGSGRVLRQGLVNADPELGVLRGIALDEVRGKNLLYDIHLFRFHGAYYTILARPPCVKIGLNML